MIFKSKTKETSKSPGESSAPKDATWRESSRKALNSQKKHPTLKTIPKVYKILMKFSNSDWEERAQATKKVQSNRSPTKISIFV